MSPTTLAEPPCPTPVEDLVRPEPHAGIRLRAVRRPFGDIPREQWDALARRTPDATPFSAWAFHRAWWDAYGENAHEETLVVEAHGGRDDPEVVAIVPLMHRHEVEPSDAYTTTKMRHGARVELTPVPPTAKAIFFGASYHADYATILAAPGDLAAVSEAFVDYLAHPTGDPWDVVDLRRIRCGDPIADALSTAVGAVEGREGWMLDIEREDVCPVVTLPDGADMEAYLGTLGKKQRHEIRRKVRRARAIGPIRLVDSSDPLTDLDEFIDLHQKRWSEDGLFPATKGGTQSRVLVRRMFELFGREGPLRLTMLMVGDRRIATGIHFETDDGILFYNAGIDPDARDLSPGVLMVYSYVERAIESGRRRIDLLRGDEPYKYDWGARDEMIQRVLIRRKENA